MDNQDIDINVAAKPLITAHTHKKPKKTKYEAFAIGCGLAILL